MAGMVCAGLVIMVSLLCMQVAVFVIPEHTWRGLIQLTAVQRAICTNGAQAIRSA